MWLGRSLGRATRELPEGLEDVLCLDGGGYTGVYTFIKTQRIIHFKIYTFHCIKILPKKRLYTQKYNKFAVDLVYKPGALLGVRTRLSA